MDARVSGRWVLAGAVALVLAAVAGVTAAPPPQSVCGPCHGGLEAAGAEHDVHLDVTHTTARVRVHRNGSATWHVTSRLRNESNFARLRRNTDLRWAIAVDAVDESREALEPARPDATVQEVWANDSAVILTYREPDVARTLLGGTLLVDEFHRSGRGSGWYVDVDRLTLVGPPGSVVSNDPLAAIGRDIGSVEGRRVTVRGAVGDPPSLAEEDVYVAFAEHGIGAGLLTTVGLATITLGRIVAGFASIHLPGLVLLGGFLAAIHTYRTRSGRGLERSLLGTWAGAPIALYLFVTMVWVPPWSSGGSWSVFATVGFGVLALLLGVLSWFSHAVLRTHAEVTGS